MSHLFWLADILEKLFPKANECLFALVSVKANFESMYFSSSTYLLGDFESYQIFILFFLWVVCNHSKENGIISMAAMLVDTNENDEGQV